jgi:2-polyprenyl-3-methyl-5-hydroxy-6-metoxy-1,4-benzoquinol methylase
MTKNVKSYFEHHSHDYADRHTQFYPSIANYLKNVTVKNNDNNNNVNNSLKLLDLGCGDGGFIKAMLGANVKFDYYGTDVSFGMIQLAKDNLLNCNIKLFVADAFNIPIKEKTKFDIIHVDSVLHHLVDKTRRKSVDKVKQVIELLVNKLSDNGILIIEEWAFLSYIIPTMASFTIFYGLKLINLLGLDLSFTSEIRPGLEVNFLHPNYLYKILNRYGSVCLFDKTNMAFPFSYRLFMLQEKSHVTFILRVGKK